MTNLTQLYLGKNKITKIENLDQLVNLECLSLQSNRIVKIENLDKLINLTELYLSENGIEKIENLDHNKQLDTLDLAKNRIKVIENVGHLQCLEEFWVSIASFIWGPEFDGKHFLLQMNDNSVSDWSCVNALAANKKLATVYLERNPIASDGTYRNKLKLAVPWLTKIDATLCR